MVEIKIVLDDSGQLGFSGPLENKVLCLGMMELAKSVVIAYQPKEQSILLARGGLPVNGEGR